MRNPNPVSNLNPSINNNKTIHSSDRGVFTIKKGSLQITVNFYNKIVYLKTVRT